MQCNIAKCFIIVDFVTVSRTMSRNVCDNFKQVKYSAIGLVAGISSPISRGRQLSSVTSRIPHETPQLYP